MNTKGVFMAFGIFCFCVAILIIPIYAIIIAERSKDCEVKCLQDGFPQYVLRQSSCYCKNIKTAKKAYDLGDK